MAVVSFVLVSDLLVGTVRHCSNAQFMAYPYGIHHKMLPEFVKKSTFCFCHIKLLVPFSTDQMYAPLSSIGFTLCTVYS
jgi:hypothetical protein